MRARAKAIGLSTPVPAGAGGLVLPWPEAFLARLRGWVALEAERGRAFLLLPIAFGLGVLVYFAAPDEPTLWAPMLLLAALTCGARAARERHGLAVALSLAASAAAGFVAAKARVDWNAHAILAGETTATITGHLEMVEKRESFDRLTIRLASAAPALGVERVRVTSRTRVAFVAGEGVRLRVRLRPPAEPALPGGYDHALDAFFAGVGAVGFSIGPVERADLPQPPLATRLRAWVDGARRAIGERIRAAIPGPSGAVADSLVTGKRDGIPEEVNRALRVSGLYHILSISGFHMALVAALVFALVRGLLALAPSLALTKPVKAWAALVALAVSTAYLVISGAEVATQRSWIMIAIVLVGVAAGRAALTLRTLAVAALVVLVLAPESLMGPSFQMSFAATLALVSGYVLLRPLAEAEAGDRRGVGGALLALTHGVTGLAFSSFAASLATTPYATHHFHALQVYGVAGNLLGAPIIEFFVMPLQILALLAWPFGFDGPIWALAGRGVDAFLWVAAWVASWPGGQVPVRGLDGVALMIWSAGFLALTLLSTPIRLAGVALMAGALALAPFAPRPLVLVDAEGTTVMARGADGRLSILSKRFNLYAVARFLEADADGRAPREAGLDAGVACDPEGCAMALAGGGRVAYSLDPSGILDDCREASLVIARARPPPDCAAKFLDLRALPWTGAVALFGTADAPRAREARRVEAARPWFRPRPGGAPPTLLTDNAAARTPSASRSIAEPTPPADPEEADAMGILSREGDQ